MIRSPRIDVRRRGRALGFEHRPDLLDRLRAIPVREQPVVADAHESEVDFTKDVELTLDPLPCWQHLDAETYRARVAEMVDDIEPDTIARHRRAETVPKGAECVRRRHPHERPKPGHRSPKPRFHAFARKVRERMVTAYRKFLAAYRVAAERLAEGDVAVSFPENCFPPPLPFVESMRLKPG